MAAQEVAIPIDSAGRLELIDRALERRLTLFPDIEGFVEARLFRAPDGTFTLEITHRVDGRLARTRRTMTAGELAQFRDRLLAAMTTRARDALLDQRGRGELLRGTFLLALGYYGWAVPYVLDVESDRSFVGAYMLTAGASFFLPLALTAHQRVTPGQASLAMWGGTRGVFLGLMLAEGLDDPATFEPDQARERVGIGLLSSVALGVAGYGLANTLTQGEADAMGMMGDLAVGAGLGVSYLLGGFDPDTVEIVDCGPGCSFAVTQNRTLGYLGGVGASVVGVWLGHRLARREPTTRGDVGVFRAAALTGAWTGFALGWSATADRDVTKADVTWGLGGLASGLVAAHLLTRNRDFTSGQGAIVSLGALGGGALGLGLGYLATPDRSNTSTPLIPSAVGAIAGYGLVYAAFASDAKEAAAIGDRLDVSFRPEALLLARGGTLLPLATATLRF